MSYEQWLITMGYKEAALVSIKIPKFLGRRKGGEALKLYYELTTKPLDYD